MRFGPAPYAEPATEPITTAEAKSHLRLDIDADDTDVASMVSAARRIVEGATGRVLVTQTWDGYLDGFPCWEICVPRGPLASVSSITYTDLDGATQTVSASDYQIDTVSVEPRIAPVLGVSWPVSKAGTFNSVKVRMVLGYGAASSVPADFKHAIRLLVGTLYEYREDQITGTVVAKAQIASSDLVARYRLPSAIYAA